MFRELVRKKQQITEEECKKILREEPRGVLSLLGDEDYPYGLPMNFWYDDETGHIFFHCGRRGHKNDALSRHDKVSFCVWNQGYRREGEWALNISSVIVFGRISLVEEEQRMKEILRHLSLKYTQDTDYIEREIERFAAKALCLELIPEHMTGKLVNES